MAGRSAERDELRHAKIAATILAIARDRSYTTFADIAPPAGLDMSVNADCDFMFRLLEVFQFRWNQTVV